MIKLGIYIFRVQAWEVDCIVLPVNLPCHAKLTLILTPPFHLPPFPLPMSGSSFQGSYKKRNITFTKAGRAGLQVAKRKAGRIAQFKAARVMPSYIPSPTEKRYKHGTLTATAASATATLTALAMPSQGAGVQDRLGDRINFTNLYGKCFATSQDTTNVVRLTFIQWMQDSGAAAPVAADIFEDSTYPWMSTFTSDSRKRRKFIVLYDKLFSVAANGPAISDPENISVPPSRFSPTTFTQGSSGGEGLIYYIYSSDSSVAPHPTINFDVTYKWIDS